MTANNIIYLSSEFNNDLYLNSGEYFTNYMNRLLNLGKYKIGLKSIYCKGALNIRVPLKPICVVSDLVGNTEINSTDMQLLKVIYPENSWQKTLCQEFNKIDYFMCSGTTVRTVSVKIVDKNQKLIDLSDQEVWLTLVLKKVE